MTDSQVLTIAIAVIVPLSMLIYSNSRISDVGRRVDDAKETLRAEIKTETTALQAQIEALRTEIRSGFERMETMLKIHELEHHAK